MEAQAAGLDTVDAARGRAFLLLAALLARPPGAELLARLHGLRADGTAFGAALAALGAAAEATTPEAVEREFNRLFIGLERGELLPYASYYVTGFLHDRPLVALRRDMARLGIARRPGIGEPEDHIAAILEMMGGLIEGHFGPPAALATQRAFFDQHLAGWAPRFFADLGTAEAARFYRPVGALGLVLLETEREGHALA